MISNKIRQAHGDARDRSRDSSSAGATLAEGDRRGRHPGLRADTPRPFPNMGRSTEINLPILVHADEINLGSESNSHTVDRTPFCIQTVPLSRSRARVFFFPFSAYRPLTTTSPRSCSRRPRRTRPSARPSPCTSRWSRTASPGPTCCGSRSCTRSRGVSGTCPPCSGGTAGPSSGRTPRPGRWGPRGRTRPSSAGSPRR
mmetsp:Transcript_12900/g.29661  ORF Transcript_12900/g.29661 Transcript_12900/m.29661 type:complete len:200 (-) Transcript_12900:373-972(-)